MQASPSFRTRIDIPEETRKPLVELLNARLADAFDLYTQLKQAHWNVKGSDFIQLHELYDAIAESVLEFVDTTAERATALGGLALGTARMAAASSSLEEYPIEAVEGTETVHAVADRLAAYGAAVREAIDVCIELGDQGTADLARTAGSSRARGVHPEVNLRDPHLAATLRAIVTELICPAAQRAA